MTAGPSPGRAPGERGFAAPVVVGLVALLATLALVVAVMGRLLADQRRAATAADLAALAGAAALQVGEPPCVAAGRSARRNGARLVSCVVEGDRVRVVAVHPSAPVLGRPVRLRSDAHAGPVA